MRSFGYCAILLGLSVLATGCNKTDTKKPTTTTPATGKNTDAPLAPGATGTKTPDTATPPMDDKNDVVKPAKTPATPDDAAEDTK